MIEGMSFAVKYLSVIKTIGVGKGQSAGETRNRNRRRKSMSGLFDQPPDDNDTSTVNITEAGCLPRAC